MATRETVSVKSTDSAERLRRLVPVKTSDSKKRKNDDDDVGSEIKEQHQSEEKHGAQLDSTSKTAIKGDASTSSADLEEDEGTGRGDTESGTWYKWVWTPGSATSQSQEGSWFSMWWRSDGTADVLKGEDGQIEEEKLQDKPPDEQEQDAARQNNTENEDVNQMAGPTGNRSWAFWSRSSSKKGELAISGTETQNHPRSAERIESNEDSDTGSRSGGDEAGVNSDAKPDGKSKSSRAATSKPKKKKPWRPNLVLPSIQDSCPEYSQSTRFKASLDRWTRYLRSEHTTVQPPLFHTTPGRIHKVVVVGVHGYFPARVVRSILGEPTGTSVKFANMAAEAVERWAGRHGFTVEVERIALEGEGKVLHRVETLYKLLSNWLDLIHAADFVFFAAHSQGTPVATHLLARLVQDGHVETAKLALLGMAGVCLGPMSGLDKKLVLKAYSSIESEMLSELFEFQRVDSFQSRKFVDSLRTIIAHDTRIILVGSLDDQLVPLYSSTCCHISHPSIYRAVYIDGQDVAPEFISTLISLALRLRNVGTTDHGLIREISSAVSGALTGRGHSRIYNEKAVYDMALEFALETTNPPSDIALQVDEEFRIPKPNDNPYLLPWSMRGLVSEAVIRESFTQQLDHLYAEFDQWSPESKVLKDVKYRLSAIQSKL
jgi:hypothetical protein